jgi:DivIVA domain-containing protein
MKLVISFEVVLRGYDRFAVDALVQKVEAAAGDKKRIAAAIKGAGPLSVVLRGYDRAQVDAWLAGRGAKAAPAGGAKPAPAPLEFMMTLRGYRPAEVDALLAIVQEALAGDDPDVRREALRAIEKAQLPVGLRGFDRRASTRTWRTPDRRVGSPPRPHADTTSEQGPPISSTSLISSW